MQVKFEEGPDALEIDELRLRVKRGEAVKVGDGEGEIPREVADRLLEQGWVEVKSTKRSSGSKED